MEDFFDYFVAPFVLMIALGVLLGFGWKLLDRLLSKHSVLYRQFVEWVRALLREGSLAAAEEQNIFLKGSAQAARRKRLAEKHERKARELRKP
jgi:hypothetical protein